MYLWPAMSVSSLEHRPGFNLRRQVDRGIRLRFCHLLLAIGYWLLAIRAAMGLADLRTRRPPLAITLGEIFGANDPKATAT
jgi:hypothetical protein